MKATSKTWWYSISSHCAALSDTQLQARKAFKWLAWLLLISAWFGLQPAQGAVVEPIFKQGNPTCSDYYGHLDGLREFKLEPVDDSDLIPDGDGTLSVTIEVQEGAKTFSWDQGGSPVIMQGVFVKGGPAGNLYDYSQLDELITSDSGLHAPENGNKFYGLSHISFCYTPGKPEIKLTKTCDFADVVNGNTVRYSYKLTAENTGTVPLYSIEATDITAKDVDLDSGNHVQTLNMLAVGESHDFFGTFRVQQNGIQNYAKVTAESLNGVIVNAFDDTACPNQEILGTLTLDKNCNVLVVNDEGQYGLQVNYSGSVCNTSNVIIENIFVSDNKDSDAPTLSDELLNYPLTLNPGECADFEGDYEPVPQEGLPLAGEAINAFEDKVTAQGVTVFGFVVKEDTENPENSNVTPAEASCTLCPTCADLEQCPVDVVQF